MQLQIDRNQFFSGLQKIIGVVERRQTMPILDNILMEVEGEVMRLTASDSEIEVQVGLALEQHYEPFSITLPAKKLFDLVRSLPDGLKLTFSFESGRCTMQAGRSHFKLSTLEADGFPLVNLDRSNRQITLSQSQLKKLLSNTQFAMAQQDVRYYLNGMLFEVDPQHLRVVATDGHRLSMADTTVITSDEPVQQIILPRKGVIELAKLLSDSVETLTLDFLPNALLVRMDTLQFVCKLVDGRFPDFRRVIPKNQSQHLTVDTALLKSTLQRVAILANEKVRGVQLHIEENLIKLQAHNADQDEAEDTLLADYHGEQISIAFNVSYLLDVLGVIPSANVTLQLANANASCLIEEQIDGINFAHVVMPMKL